MLRTPTMMAEAETVCVHCCPLCDFTTSTLAQWFSHLRAAHSSDPSFHVTCGIDGCQRTYVKFSSLNTHVYIHHRDRMCDISGGVTTLMAVFHLHSVIQAHSIHLLLVVPTCVGIAQNSCHFQPLTSRKVALTSF